MNEYMDQEEWQWQATLSNITVDLLPRRPDNGPLWAIDESELSREAEWCAGEFWTTGALIPT